MIEGRFCVFKRVVLLGLLIAIGCLAGFAADDGNIAVYAHNDTIMVFWDPSDTFSNEAVVLHNVYETLLRYDPVTDEVIPVLATSFEVSEDGLTWTFNLREGVTFHTGGTMNAQAVKASIERTIDRGKGASFIWDPVASICVVDEYTVAFHLAYQYPMDIIAASAYAAYIFDPDYADHDWFTAGHDSGTGPYTIDSFTGSEMIVVKRFDEYWGGWDGEHFETIVFQTVEEDGTRRMMIESGEADYVRKLTTTELEALRSNPTVDVVASGSYENLLAVYNMAKTDGSPISNPLIRKAISYAIPYDDIIEGVVGGYAEKARGVVPQGLWGYSNRVKQYTYLSLIHI